MIEYEYSFRVKDIKPYIEYCIKNNFEKISENYQIRKLYTNENKILARLTTKIEGNSRTTTLDFKDEDDSNKILKSARETIPFVVNSKNKEAIYSMLEILDYKVSKTLERQRIVYKKGNVEFEIDEYIKPQKCFVVAIEGEKDLVDKIYEELKDTE